MPVNDGFDNDADTDIDCADSDCDEKLCGQNENQRCYDGMCVDILTFEPHCGIPPENCGYGFICEYGNCNQISAAFSSGAPGFEISIIIIFISLLLLSLLSYRYVKI